MKKLYKNSIYNVIYRITNVLFSLITAGYVARILLPEGVGYFSYINTNVSYFVIFASLGLPAYGIREVAKAKKDRELLNRTYSELFIINAVFTLLSCFVYLFFVLNIFNNSDLLLYGICGSQIIFNIINIDWLFQGYEEYSYIARKNLVVKIVFFILIVLFVNDKSDLPIYALISCFATFSQYFYSIVRSRKFVSFSLKNISIKRHMKPIIILGVTVIFSTVYHKIDITMLGLLTNDAEVGLYTNAHRCIEIISILCASITSVYLPTLSEVYLRNIDEFKTILRNGYKIICFISIPAAFGLFVIAPEVMGLLFGNAFVSGYITIRYFVPMIIIRGLGDLFCYQSLIAIGKEDKRVLANIITTFINIIVNYLLIPTMGRNGAAIASVISELFINVYLYIIIKKSLSIKEDLKPFFNSLVSSLIMSCVCYFMINLKIGNAYLNIIICIIISFIVYAACYYLIDILLNNRKLHKS